MTKREKRVVWATGGLVLLFPIIYVGWILYQISLASAVGFGFLFLGIVTWA